MLERLGELQPANAAEADAFTEAARQSAWADRIEDTLSVEQPSAGVLMWLTEAHAILQGL